MSIAFERGAKQFYDHDLQAFHRAGLAAAGSYLVLLIVSLLLRSERDPEREQYVWWRYRHDPNDGASAPRPRWQDDRLWAVILAICTLALCWYFR